MKYWRFFPAPDTAWGCLPVWGFAVVAESRAEGVTVGRRFWGYCRPARTSSCSPRVSPALQAAYTAQFDGRADARAGLILTLQAQV